jgi:site-specific recombinase
VSATGATPSSAELAGLFAQLGSLPDGPGAREARVAWLTAFVKWLRSDGLHLAVLTSHLRADAAAAALFRDAMRRILDGTDALRLFTEAGLPARSSIPEDALVRMVRWVIPHAVAPGDAWDLLREVMGDVREPLWLRYRSAEEVEDFLDASGLTSCGHFRALHVQLAESVEVHAVRAAAIGYFDDVRRAAGRVAVAESPFHRLAKASTRLLAAVTAEPADTAAAGAARDEIEPALADARRVREHVYQHLERSGVSTDMVMRLDTLGICLDRIAAALPVLAPRPGERRAATVTRVLSEIAAGVREQGSFRRAMADRTRLLAKSVVERCGATGSHYITSGRRDWWEMAGKGAGGGVVIGFVVWAKVSLHALHPPPGVYTFLGFLDYAIGFLVIYGFGLALATKQPPMTAATLADAFAQGGEGRDLEPVVTLVQRICRSQVAGLLGNVLATALTAFALDLGVHALTGHSMIGETEARETLEGHDPFGSPCLLFAVVTGTAVWMSSMVSGWAENAAHYGRLVDSLASARGGRVTAWLVRNVGGVAGNVSLALFLVMISFAGTISGIPWDVRHVTVSTGIVTASLVAVPDLTSSDIGWSVTGVLLVGVLNIATGFALSFWVATRARGIRARFRLALVPALLASLARHPFRFLLPVVDDDAGAPAH